MVITLYKLYTVTREGNYAVLVRICITRESYNQYP